VKSLKVILPVAGIGKRLRPHTLTTPKVLLKVAGRPIISYLMEEIVKIPSPELIFIIGHLGKEVEQYIKENYRVKTSFIYQEEQLGLGHAVYMAKKFVKEEDEILILLGDTVFEFDLLKIVNGKQSLVGVKQVENPSRFGVVQLKENKVFNFVEKPEKLVSDLAIVGIYYIKNAGELFQSLGELLEQGRKTKGEFQLTDGLQSLVNRGHEIGVFPVEGWYDCGKPETLLATNKHLLEKHSVKVKIQGSVVTQPVFIEKSADIKKSIIGPFVSIGNDCKVNDSVVRNSIVYDNAEVKNSVVENMVVGKSEVIENRGV